MKRLRQSAKWLLLLVVLGGLFWGWRIYSRPTVYFVHPQQKEVISLVIATGKIRAAQQSTLLSDITATVQRLYVDEGDTVKRGQKLVRLHQLDMASRLQQAKATIATARRVLLQTRRGPLPSERMQARADYQLAVSRYQQARLEQERALRLFQRKALPKADYDQTRFAASQARASVLAAKSRLLRLNEMPRKEDVKVAQARLREAYASYRVLQTQAGKQLITAPFDGLVVSRAVSLGQNVNPNTTLLTMADPASLEIYAETDENNLSHLRVGQQAQVVATAYPKRPFAATLQKISPAVDNKRGVIGLRLAFAEKPSFALLDMTVDVNIEAKRWPNAWSVPVEALVRRRERNFLMVLRNGVTQLRPIQLLGRNVDRAVIPKLAPQTSVLLQAHSLTEGQRIKARLLPSSPTRIKARLLPSSPTPQGAE